MRRQFALLGAIFLLAACSPGEKVDSKTNWLKVCDSDAVCGAELSCICGVCSQECESGDACGGGVCADEMAIATQVQCGVSPAQASCRTVCETDEDCEGSAICLRGACATAESVASDSCGAVSDWTSDDVELELQLFERLNEARTEGMLPCSMGSLPPLIFDSRLRCASRLHALDMSERGYSDVVSPDGEGANQRSERAGYPVGAWGISISQAPDQSPEEVITSFADQYGDGDIGLDTNCLNVADPDYVHVGIGYLDGVFSLHFAEPSL